MSSRRYGLAVVAAFAVAVALRTLPLYQSPLPFNPDGVHHATLAAEAVATDRLPLARMATDELVFAPLLAVLSELTGIAPLRLGQPLSALVGAAPVVLAVAVVRRLTAALGWSARRRFAAATLAGLLLAVEGLYLHRSMPTDEQTLGLFLVPLAAVAVVRWHRTGRRAWLVAGIVAALVLPPLHNLDATVLALSLTMLVALSLVRSRGRSAAPLAALAVAVWLYVAGYHVLVDRVTPAAIVQESRITEVPELLLAWLVLVAVALVWFAGTRRGAQRALGLSAFGAGFAVLAVNAVVPVFPGTPATPSLLLAGLLPLAVPVALAVWAVPTALADRATGPALVALGAAVFVLVGLSMTASLTPEYLNTVYRAQTFVHFPAMALAAVGTVGAAASYLPSRRAVRAGAAVVVVVCAVASVPVAFGGLELLNYKGVTTPGELSASEFAATHATETWAGDDHVVRNARNLALDPAGAVGPVYDWLRGGAPPPDCLVVGQHSWTTAGAQFYPAPPERLPGAAYEAWRLTGSVVYHGGADDPVVMVAPTGSC